MQLRAFGDGTGGPVWVDSVSPSAGGRHSGDHRPGRSAGSCDQSEVVWIDDGGNQSFVRRRAVCRADPKSRLQGRSESQRKAGSTQSASLEVDEERRGRRIDNFGRFRAGEQNGASHQSATGQQSRRWTNWSDQRRVLGHSCQTKHHLPSELLCAGIGGFQGTTDCIDRERRWNKAVRVCRGNRDRQ